MGLFVNRQFKKCFYNKMLVYLKGAGTAINGTTGQDRIPNLRGKYRLRSNVERQQRNGNYIKGALSRGFRRFLV